MHKTYSSNHGLSPTIRRKMTLIQYALLASLLPLALASAAPSTLSWPDSHLVSRRYSSHHKRFVDEAGNYNITIFHLNDVHAHLDQFTASGADCHPEDGKPCYGGYARVKTKVDELRGVYKDSLFINAGDEFQVGWALFTAISVVLRRVMN